MSLPTTKPAPAQLSIRSFFQAKQPKYTPPPPPSSTTTHDANSSSKTTTATTHLSPSPTDSHTTDTAAAAAAAAAAVSPPVVLLPPLPSTLPPEATIRPITESDIPPLRRINSLLLQVSYPDTFYHRAATDRAHLSRVITWTHGAQTPIIIGAIVTHAEPTTHTLYIRSLCLLSPYRSLGLMSAALDHVVATAAADPALDIRTVTAHVWTENEDGLHWYESRGFARQEPPVKGYYMNLRPDSAFLVSRNVGASVSSHLRRVDGSAAPSRPVIAASTTAEVLNLPSHPAPAPAAAAAAAAAAPSPPPPQEQRPKAKTGQSYQNQGPDMGWNDLPSDMAPTLSALRKTGSESVSVSASASASASAASSRSSSSAPRKKRDRAYPTAAFGS